MRRTRTLSLTALIAILIAGGIFFTGGEQAESQQPQEFSYTTSELGQDLYSFPAFSAAQVIEIAQSNCGNDTCSADQCCFLNTETGAQCGNCVESCKRGSPC